MATITGELYPCAPETAGRARAQPVRLRIDRTIESRDRLTSAFRIFLAVPHLLLVGGPIAFGVSWLWTSQHGEWGAGGGVLGAVAGVCALIGWFAIVFTGRLPNGLWNLAAFYLRWRARAVAYTALLTDRYPPFGEGPYPVELAIEGPPLERDRVRVAFRIFLALPHILCVWALGLAWAVASMIAWLAILITGRYPAALYDFAVGVLCWELRVEAYLLLLHDVYPPFSLEE